MTNIVYIKQNRVLTDSFKLAETFGKRHDHVLRKIEARIKGFTPEFAALNFQAGSYLDSNNQSRVKYELTQTGFTSIAVSFTGLEAARYTEKVLTEFDRMQSELNKRGIRTYSQVELLEMSLVEIKRLTAAVVKAEARVSALQDNAASSALAYGIKAKEALLAYPAITAAAKHFRIPYALKNTPTEAARLSIFLKDVHGLSTSSRDHSGKWPVTLFDKAQLDALEAKLKGV